MRVLQVSTRNEECGSASYARQLIASLQALPDVICDVYPSRRVHHGPPSDEEQHDVFEGLLVLANTVDVVHIQHEFAGTGLRSIRQFGGLLRQLRRRDVTVVVTFHTDPVLASRYQRVSWRWHVARHFRRGPRRPHAIVASMHSRQLLIASGFEPAQVHVVTATQNRDLAARHLDIYAALVHRSVPSSELRQSPTYLDLAHAPRVADLFLGRGRGCGATR